MQRASREIAVRQQAPPTRSERVTRAPWTTRADAEAPASAARVAAKTASTRRVIGKSSFRSSN